MATKTYEYRNSNWYKNEGLVSVKAKTSEELHKMAEKIFANGKIKSAKNYYDTTISFEVVCVGLPIKYIVKIDCGEVQEIIEVIGV